MVNRAEDRHGHVIDRVRQMLCGLHGHDSMLQFERDRMFLRCVSCGHETPGWALNETAPVVTTVRAETRQEPLVQSRLISARRVA